MGSGHHKSANTIKIEANNLNITHSRLMQSLEAAKINVKDKDKLKLDPFKRLIGWELQLQGISPQILSSTMLTSEVYFQDQQSLDAYLGYMVCLKQICHLNIYDDFQLQTDKSPFSITTRQQLMGIPRPLDRMEIKKSVEKFIHLLTFLSQILVKTQNIYIIPEDVVELNNQFYLRGFLQRECPKKKLIMAYIVWLYEEFENFDDCLNVETTISSFNSLDRYIKEIFFTIKNNRIDDEDLVKYFKNLNEKMKYLEGGFDSFHVCFRSKRQKYNTNVGREWLIAKKSNQIYFFNIEDEHLCQGRVMRKSKKISVENTHILFNSSDFEVNFMLQGTKNMVKTTEFQLQDCFTISDIEIKYKFPFRVRNPLMFLRGREIYMLDQMMYRYSIDQNKIYQQSKKINDSLYLVQSVDLNYVVIRHSIDIFRYGIKIYTSDRYDTLMPSGNAQMAVLMETIKIDIKHVQFCTEVYKGVFLMLSDKNFWILDLNFMCFFSYTPLQRIYNLYKGKGSQLQMNDYIFQTLGQPFSINWLAHQQGLNVHIQQDIMHVVASVTGKLFYLQYRFIFEAGLLKLIKYRPLYQQDTLPVTITEAVAKTKQSYFNVYNQSMLMYKNTSWIHKGPIFLEVKKLKMSLCKNLTQIFVETEEMIKNIKDIIEENKKIELRWSKLEITILLYKTLSMMSFLNQNSIAYKNFNLSNLWITVKKELKLAGWSEPQRNWHISDFKDYLLTCFNIITQNNYEKLNDKFLQKHEAEMDAFPVLREKMQLSIRNKMPEKRADAEKQLLSIKESLNQQIYRFIQPYRSGNLLFSFQKNTPRFSMLNIAEGKIKKMVAIIQSHNNHQEFTFKQSDEYTWSDHTGCLYVFTATYQMYEIKPNIEDMKEETIIIQQYEYLPNNIINCSFIACKNGLYAFGGISRNSKKKVHYNLNVYHFNPSKLTWEAVAQLDSARVKPSLVLSQSGTHIYAMSGELGLGSDSLEYFVFDITTHKVEKMIDMGLTNPFKKLTEKHAFKVFQISQKYNIFLMWSVNAIAYQFKLFSSLIAGFQIDFDGKIYLQENAELPTISIAFADGAIHFLRPYGKYSKITIEGLESPKIVNKTLYST